MLSLASCMELGELRGKCEIKTCLKIFFKVTNATLKQESKEQRFLPIVTLINDLDNTALFFLLLARSFRSVEIGQSMPMILKKPDN